MPHRGPAFSSIEQKFLLKALADGCRLDHREMLSYREIQISFGMDYGCCTVDMGQTKVMAQVAAEMDRPRESRPSEGRLNVHVEMSTIAFPTFDPTKPLELGVTVQRMVERSLILSRAVDLEQLCVRVGEKAWTIQLYIHVLSHDGNIIDCAFVAAIAALRHFRRPDISVTGQDIVIHTMEEKDPLPLTLHHMPLCISFAFFKDCERMVLDATYLEEKVMDGTMMISMNKHNEVCSLQMSGQMQITKEQILRCTSIAYLKVKDLTELIIKALNADVREKKSGKTKSVTVLRSSEKPDDVKSEINVNMKPVEEIEVEKLTITEKNGDKPTENDKKPCWLTKHADQTASIGEGLVNSWSETNTGAGMGIFKALRKESSEEENDSGSEDEVIILNDSFTT